MKRIWVCFFLSILVVGSRADGIENKIENWYSYWGFGWADFSYPRELNTSINGAKNAGLENVAVCLDLLGFYWPKGESTLMGAIFNGAADKFEEGSLNFQINSYQVSMSVLHFITREIGNGPFIRIDAGPSKIFLETNFTGENDYNSEWGYGFLAGAGVGFPVASGTRITIGINYTVRRIEGENYKIMMASLGGLF